MNYTINQLPFIEEDAGIFDLEEIQEKCKSTKIYRR